MEEHFRFLITPAELGVPPVSRMEIIERLGRFSLGYLLRALGKLNVLLCAADSLEPKQQVGIIARLWGERVADRLQAMLPAQYRDNAVFFSDRQTLYAARLGLAACPQTVEQEPDPVDLLVPLIAVNVHFERQFWAKMADAQDTQDQKTAVTEEVIRNLSFDDIDNFGKVLARYRGIFRQGGPQLRNPLVDVEAEFLKFNGGVSIDHYQAIGFSALSLSLNGAEGIGLDSYKQNRLEQSEVAKVLGAWAMSLEEARTECIPKIDSSPYDALLFYSKPLIEITPGKYVVVHPRLLLEKITRGLFWSVFDALPVDRRELFSNHFGQLLERYCQALTSSALPGPPRSNGHRYYPEAPYGKEKLSADFAVSVDRSLALFEVTSSRLRKKDTMITGDIDAFGKDVQTKMLKKAKQLNGQIDDIESGRLGYQGLDLQQLSEIFPVTVINDPFPLTSLTWEILNNALRSNHWLEQPRTKPLRIMDTSELETLMALLEEGKRLDDLLREWVDSPSCGELSLTSFLREKGLKPGYSRYVRGQLDDLKAEIGSTLFGGKT